jgi:hypothetical protein
MRAPRRWTSLWCWPCCPTAEAVTEEWNLAGWNQARLRRPLRCTRETISPPRPERLSPVRSLSRSRTAPTARQWGRGQNERERAGRCYTQQGRGHSTLNAFHSLAERLRICRRRCCSLRRRFARATRRSLLSAGESKNWTQDDSLDCRESAPCQCERVTRSCVAVAWRHDSVSDAHKTSSGIETRLRCARYSLAPAKRPSRRRDGRGDAVAVRNLSIAHRENAFASQEDAFLL